MAMTITAVDLARLSRFPSQRDGSLRLPVFPAFAGQPVRRAGLLATVCAGGLAIVDGRGHLAERVRALRAVRAGERAARRSVVLRSGAGDPLFCGSSSGLCRRAGPD